MSDFYYIYATSHVPEELAAKHNSAKTYADSLVTLFIESYKQVTSEEPTHQIDLSVVPMANVELEIEGMTQEQLEQQVLGFIELIKSGEAIGSEVCISHEQGVLLFNGIFKDKEEI